MDTTLESFATYELHRALHNRVVTRQLIVSAHRVMTRGRGLRHAVRDRRRQSDFFRHLAKYAEMFPRMRQLLPLCGGESALVRIETEERPEGIVAHVSGEVDIANVHYFKAALQPAVSNGHNVILDVGRLRYIDSTGLAVVVNAHKALRRHNRRLVVAAPSPTVAKVMRIFGLDGLAPLVASLDEAVRLLRGSAAADG